MTISGVPRDVDDMPPSVTVVIATYNRAGMVGTAIRSVLEQTYADLELVVVDDCSPDNTRDVVEAVANPRVRYVRHERNSGLPAGRNTGIRAARGEFVAFLDDDDTWLPHKLERQLKAIPGFDAVLCAARVEGRKGSKIYRHDEVTPAQLRRGNRFDPSGLLVRRSLIAALGFDESLRNGEDWDAFIRIAAEGRIAYLHEPLLVYNNGDHQRMTNEIRFDDAALENRLRVVHKHRDFFGAYWYRYHCAYNVLFYFTSHPNLFSVLWGAGRRYGPIPVVHVAANRALARLQSLRR